jgi:hypothetical protein
MNKKISYAETNKIFLEFLLCPIPEDQKPIIQYIELKTGAFSSWVFLKKKDYELSLGFFFVLGFMILSLPDIFQQFFLFFENFSSNLIVFNSFNEVFYILSNFFNFFYLKVLIVNCFFLFLFIILLVRYSDIENRFSKSFVVYEESSWYDGQIWQKPISILKIDNLIQSQKIKPVLDRIRKTLFIFLILNFFFILFNQSF